MICGNGGALLCGQYYAGFYKQGLLHPRRQVRVGAGGRLLLKYCQPTTFAFRTGPKENIVCCGQGGELFWVFLLQSIATTSVVARELGERNHLANEGSEMACTYVVAGISLPRRGSMIRYSGTADFCAATGIWTKINVNFTGLGFSFA